jgi:hypothetical protein
MIQLIPIKLLENGSLNPGTAKISSFATLGRNQVRLCAISYFQDHPIGLSLLYFAVY